MLFGAIGNGRRECEFYEELSDLLGGRPCVEPVEVAATWDTSLIEDVTDDMANEDDSQREPSTDYCEGSSAKKAKTSIDAMKKRSKSSSKNKTKSEIVQMIEKIHEQRNEQENQYLEVMKKMHDDKMEVMKGLLGVLQTLAQDKSKTS